MNNKAMTTRDEALQSVNFHHGRIEDMPKEWVDREFIRSVAVNNPGRIFHHKSADRSRYLGLLKIPEDIVYVCEKNRNSVKYVQDMPVDDALKDFLYCICVKNSAYGIEHIPKEKQTRAILDSLMAEISRFAEYRSNSAQGYLLQINPSIINECDITTLFKKSHERLIYIPERLRTEAYFNKLLDIVIDKPKHIELFLNDAINLSLLDGHPLFTTKMAKRIVEKYPKLLHMIPANLRPRDACLRACLQNREAFILVPEAYRKEIALIMIDDIMADFDLVAPDSIMQMAKSNRSSTVKSIVQSALANFSAEQVAPLTKTPKQCSIFREVFGSDATMRLLKLSSREKKQLISDDFAL